MPANDLETRIREKFARKMQNVAHRLSELEQDESVDAALKEVADEISAVDAELESSQSTDGEPGFGQRERLEARRERLLAKQERLTLRVELLQERRDRLTESLDDLKSQLDESLGRVHEQVRRRVPSDAGARWPFVPPQSSTSNEANARKLQEERRKILEMVQQGTITADEAGRLLDALRDQEEGDRRPRRRPRWVRIRVTDTSSDLVRINLTLPVGLVRAGLRAGGSIAGVEGLDTAGLEDMLDRGETGHLLDLQNSDGGERVEIFVE